MRAIQKGWDTQMPQQAQPDLPLSHLSCASVPFLPSIPHVGEDTDFIHSSLLSPFLLFCYAL